MSQIGSHNGFISATGGFIVPCNCCGLSTTCCLCNDVTVPYCIPKYGPHSSCNNCAPFWQPGDTRLDSARCQSMGRCCCGRKVGCTLTLSSHYTDILDHTSYGDNGWYQNVYIEDTSQTNAVYQFELELLREIKAGIWYCNPTGRMTGQERAGSYLHNFVVHSSDGDFEEHWEYDISPWEMFDDGLVFGGGPGAGRMFVMEPCRPGSSRIWEFAVSYSWYRGGEPLYNPDVPGAPIVSGLSDFALGWMRILEGNCSQSWDQVFASGTPPYYSFVKKYVGHGNASSDCLSVTMDIDSLMTTEETNDPPFGERYTSTGIVGGGGSLSFQMVILEPAQTGCCDGAGDWICGGGCGGGGL